MTDTGPGGVSGEWDGRDTGGRMVPPGIYYWRLGTGRAVYSGKIVKIK
jgi:hypothetical protein